MSIQFLLKDYLVASTSCKQKRKLLAVGHKWTIIQITEESFSRWLISAVTNEKHHTCPESNNIKLERFIVNNYSRLILVITGTNSEWYLLLFLLVGTFGCILGVQKSLLIIPTCWFYLLYLPVLESFKSLKSAASQPKYARMGNTRILNH